MAVHIRNVNHTSLVNQYELDEFRLSWGRQLEDTFPPELNCSARPFLHYLSWQLDAVLSP